MIGGGHRGHVLYLFLILGQVLIGGEPAEIQHILITALGPLLTFLLLLPLLLLLTPATVLLPSPVVRLRHSEYMINFYKSLLCVGLGQKMVNLEPHAP